MGLWLIHLLTRRPASETSGPDDSALLWWMTSGPLWQHALMLAGLAVVGLTLSLIR